MNWYLWFLWSLALIGDDPIYGAYNDRWYERNLTILQDGMPLDIITEYGSGNGHKATLVEDTYAYPEDDISVGGYYVLRRER